MPALTGPVTKCTPWPSTSPRILVRPVAGLGEQEPLPLERRGRLAHARDVVGTVAIALLERWPRVAGGLTLGGGAHERQDEAVEAADRAGVAGAGGAERPARQSGVRH